MAEEAKYEMKNLHLIKNASFVNGSSITQCNVLSSHAKREIR